MNIENTIKNRSEILISQREEAINYILGRTPLFLTRKMWAKICSKDIKMIEKTFEANRTEYEWNDFAIRTKRKIIESILLFIFHMIGALMVWNLLQIITGLFDGIYIKNFLQNLR